MERNQLMDNKGNPILKEFIGMLARSDTKHDFNGTAFSADAATAENMNKGLMNVEKKNFTDEQGSLWNVLTDLGGLTEPEKKEALNDFLTTPPEDTVFNVGFRDFDTNSVTNLHSYKVSFVNVEDDAFKGEAFRVACNLHTGAALIVDFNQHGFLSKLVGDDSLNRAHKPIYVITNSELINDAAPKAKYNDPSLFNESSALISLIDLNPESKIYSKWDDRSLDYRNLFLTSYNYELSKLNQVKNIFGKTEKLITTLTVSNSSGNSTQVVVKDTKLNNGKLEIWKKISSLFSAFTRNVFQVNQGFQRKRSGDWCQVISCFYLNNKKYYSKDLNRVISNLVFENKSIFFVTHDYIAASFALLLGVNVIFLSVSGGGRPPRAYFFRNERNEITSLSDMYDTIRSEYVTPNLLTFITRYNDVRTRNLVERYAVLMNDVDGSIKTLENYLNLAGKKNPEELKRRCLSVFENLYVYHQLKQSTPEVDDILPILRDNRILNKSKEYWIENNAEYIKTQYEMICNARSIQSKYNTDEILEPQINAIKNTQLFLTIKHWTYTKELKFNDTYSRLGVGVGADNSLVTQDKLAFLPFFQTCEKSIKSKVSKVFQLLYKKIEMQEENERTQFFEGRKNGSTYQHAILSFKILSSSVGIFLNDTFENKDKVNFNTLKKEKARKYESNNLLSLSKVIEENEAVKRIRQLTPDLETETLLITEDPKEEESLVEQVGGLYLSPAARTLIDNSISETTDVLLTSHLILSSTKAEARAANAANRNFRSGLLEGGQFMNKNMTITNKNSKQASEQYPVHLPLYIVLEGLRRCIDELNYNPDYNNYVKYYLLVESMYKALKGNTNEIIGLGLRETLITFITTEIGRKKVGFLFKNEDSFFKNFMYLTSSLGYSICGTFVDYDNNVSDVIDNALNIVSDPIFGSYMNNVMSIFKDSQRRIKNEFYTQTMEFNLSHFAKVVDTLQTMIGNEIIYGNKPIFYTIKNKNGMSLSSNGKSSPSSFLSYPKSPNSKSQSSSPYSKASVWSNNSLRNIQGTPQTVGGRRKTRKYKKQ